MQEQQKQETKDYDFVLLDSSNLLRRFYEIYQSKKKQDPNIQSYFVIKDDKKIDISPIRNYIKHIYDLRQQFPNSQFYHCFDDPIIENLNKYKTDPTYKEKNTRSPEFVEFIQNAPSFIAHTLQVPYSVSGYEAESVIYSIAKTLLDVAEQKDLEPKILIYSNGKSFENFLIDNIIDQCVSFSPSTGAKYSTYSSVKESIGFSPWLKPVHNALVDFGISKDVATAFLKHPEFNMQMPSDFQSVALDNHTLPSDKRFSTESLTASLTAFLPENKRDKDNSKEFEKLANELNSLEKLNQLFDRIGFHLCEVIEPSQFPENSKKMKQNLANMSATRFREIIQKSSNLFKTSENLLAGMQPRNAHFFARPQVSQQRAENTNYVSPRP